MANSKGSRIYSVKEIHEMCQNGLSNEMLAFCERAPESIKKIIWTHACEEVRNTISSLHATDKQQKSSTNHCELVEQVICDDAAEVLSVNGEHYIPDEDLNDEIVEVATRECQFEQLKIELPAIESNIEIIPVDSGTEKTVSQEAGQMMRDNSKEEVDVQPNPSPYANIEFGVRIEVDELWITLTEKQNCPIHGIPYKNTQVMTRFARTKKYGAMLNCCPGCKRIYMKRQELNEYLPIFKAKGIIYQLEEGER